MLETTDRSTSRLIVDDYWTPEQVCAQLGDPPLTDRTLRNYQYDRVDPLLPSKIGGKRLFKKTTVIAWAARREKKPPVPKTPRATPPRRVTSSAKPPAALRNPRRRADHATREGQAET